MPGRHLRVSRRRKTRRDFQWDCLVLSSRATPIPQRICPGSDTCEAPGLACRVAACGVRDRRWSGWPGAVEAWPLPYAVHASPAADHPVIGRRLEVGGFGYSGCALPQTPPTNKEGFPKEALFVD